MLGMLAQVHACNLTADQRQILNSTSVNITVNFWMKAMQLISYVSTPNGPATVHPEVRTYTAYVQAN